MKHGELYQGRSLKKHAGGFSGILSVPQGLRLKLVFGANIKEANKMLPLLSL